jgi:hypothetical protein
MVDIKKCGRSLHLENTVQRTTHGVHVCKPDFSRNIWRRFHQEFHEMVVLQQARILEHLNVCFRLPQFADLLQHVLAYLDVAQDQSGHGSGHLRLQGSAKEALHR